jgi:hypothetical protein
MRFLPLLLALALLPGLCAAQDSSTDGSADNAIHAVTTLHDDGTKTVTITDPDKHSSEASTYDAGNKLVQKIIYTLDDNNQPASGVVYTATDRPLFKSVYKRDDFSRVVEEDDYSMDDQLIRRFVYEFGANGQVVRIRAYDGQGNELQETPAHKDRRQSLPRVH